MKKQDKLLENDTVPLLTITKIEKKTIDKMVKLLNS